MENYRDADCCENCISCLIRYDYEGDFKEHICNFDKYIDTSDGFVDWSKVSPKEIAYTYPTCVCDSFKRKI